MAGRALSHTPVGSPPGRQVMWPGYAGCPRRLDASPTPMPWMARPDIPPTLLRRGNKVPHPNSPGPPLDGTTDLPSRIKPCWLGVKTPQLYVKVVPTRRALMHCRRKLLFICWGLGISCILWEAGEGWEVTNLP